LIRRFILPKFRSTGGGLSASQSQDFGSTRGKTLNPDEEAGMADARRIMKNPAYADDRHPQHLEAVRAVKQILVGCYGESEAECDEACRPPSAQERVLSRK
jgi:hypothetical protein